MLLKCNCIQVPVHGCKSQNQIYGKNIRVFNYPCKSKQTGKWTAARCTVCGTMQEVKDAQ